MNLNKNISIIIPTYNREKIIGRTLDSILAQTYQYWECIVVDDLSKDNTKSVVEEYTTKDKRIVYCANERKKGAQGARNTGLLRAKYDWVFFFDSDNVLHPVFLEEMTSGINDRVDVIQCFSRVIDVENGETGRYFKWCSYGNIHKQLFEGSTYVDFNHAIIRKTKVLEIGCLDEDCPSMQEWDTHIRLSNIANYTTIEKVLVDYYVGAKDAISSDTKREVIGRMYILTKHIDEWKSMTKAIRRFSYTIYYLISRNKDENFRKEYKKRLKEIVPNIQLYLAINKVGQFVKKLLK